MIKRILLMILCHTGKYNVELMVRIFKVSAILENGNSEKNL